MCYSTTMRKDKHDTRIEGRIRQQLKFPELYEPFYRANGFAHPNLYIIRQEEPDVIVPAQWGLIPPFGKNDPKSFYKKYNTLNAKSETVFKSNTYRHSIHDQRCLILADGFHEPHHVKNVSYPFFCHYPDDSVFCFAGIYTALDEDSDQYSCSILTTAANKQFEFIHNRRKRMPLILDENYEEDWLSDLTEPAIEDLLKTAFTTKEIEAYPISRDLYKRDIDSNNELAITKVDYPELGEQASLF